MLARLAVCALLATAGAAHAAAPAPMGYADAHHLLLRTGFAPTDADVREYAALTRSEGVERLLQRTRTTAITPAPAFASDITPLRYPSPNTAPPEERRAYERMRVRQGLELRAWWVQEMLVTPSPLTERMTLFWHNHFVSSEQKVRYSRLMHAQNATFRANALGNFGTLLHAASKEPAMLLYLDGAQSRKQQPNENFAREVMELFTLGEGHYTEQDVKDAARAFTGWSIDRGTGAYTYRPALHDTGVKTVLGTSGNLNGDAVLDLILARPETATFVTTKLWREFVSPDPDPREVERIAQIFRSRDYDIKAALRALLLCDAFWDAGNRGTLVKSPAELVVGALRQLEVTPAAVLPFAVATSGMGQNLFSPPNVKGWPGGEVWINSNTLLARKQFLDRIARNDDARPAMGTPSPAPMATAVPAAATASAASLTAAAPVAAMAGMAPAAMTAPATDAALLQLRAPASAVVAADNPAAAADLATADDRKRVQRYNQALDRALRNIGFNAARWVSMQPGDTALAKMQAAQTLLLPIDAAMADAPTADTEPQAFVRALLLDPAYQLK